MSARPEPVIPETRRRRADTIAKSRHIMEMSKQLTLTRSVLADALARATPVQLDFIEHWFQAELESRDHAKKDDTITSMGLKRERSKKGWTQEELAKRMGLPQQRISEYENGQDMRVSRAKKFAELLGCTLEAITDDIKTEA